LATDDKSLKIPIFQEAGVRQIADMTKSYQMQLKTVVHTVTVVE